jgi:Mn2+/Fe2+ NRAMP family transporter
MNRLPKLIAREIASLFVDDGMLATQIVALVAAALALVRLAGIDALAGAVLVGLGCLVILALSLARKARKTPR